MPNVTLSTVCLALLLLGPGEAAPRACPAPCRCDGDTSLVNCAGPGDEASNNGPVVGASRKNDALPTDAWLAVARLAARRLEVLDLTLDAIHRQLVNGTESLTELGLVRCSLASIGNGTFARHALLERLDLSQNQLTVLTEGMLTGLIRLRSLDASANKLTKIDGALGTLTALQQLNLRGNALLVLSADALRGLGRLQFLNVEGNSLGAIEESAFQGLDQLAHLVLSGNPLGGTQHVDLFAARLTYVDLSSAGLDAVPSLITRFVRDLRLSGNNFRRLQRGDLDSVAQVHLLVLDECGVEEVEEDALGRLEQLETLSLNGNRLLAVPASLPGSALVALYLEANRITALRSGDLAGLRRLDQLHLARNGIESIDGAAFHHTTSLTRLDLSGNRLRHVNKDTFAALVSLQFLDLSDNPLVITRTEVDRLCHLSTVIKVAITTQPTTEEDATVAIATPRAIEAKPDHNGANEVSPVTSTAAKSEAAPPASTTGALSFVGVLLSLSVLIVALFIGTGRWMRQSNWRGDKQSTSAAWTRQVADNGAALRPAKDVVRLGWVSGEEFDHWSTALLQNDTEHERLLLAVAPHH